MRVLIVDDEPLSREALKNALEERHDIDHYDVAIDSEDALCKIGVCSYDILLLDIHMPELSGIALVDHLHIQKTLLPAIIFVTAYDEHAVAAFEMQAADYVLKPFSNARVHRALDMAKRRSSEERTTKMLELIPHLELMSTPDTKIAIKSKGRITLIDPKTIIAIEAEGNYVLLHQKSGSHLLREQISSLSEKLKQYGFIRIHRSVLVNTSHIETLEPLPTGEYLLRTEDGKTYNVTRTYKNNLKSLAKFRLGFDSLMEP